MMLNRSPSDFWQDALRLGILVNLIILGWTIIRLLQVGVKLSQSVWIFPLVFYVATIIFHTFVYINFQQVANTWLEKTFEKKTAPLLMYRVLGLVIFAAVLILLPLLKIQLQIGQSKPGSTIDITLAMLLFFWGCWWLFWMAVLGIKLIFDKAWYISFVAAALVMGVVYTIYIIALNITSYPFSMGWSEASRYYYGSLLFAGQLYNQQLPLSFLHPTRYFLQSIPFVLPAQDLVLHRTWQVFLWISLTGLAAWSLARRLAGNKWLLLGLAAWAFVFWLKIGVYYHLQVMTFFVFAFTDFRKPRQTLLVLLATSVWAGMSRVNWFPVPAMLVLAIYLMEEPASNHKTILAYLKWPVIWTVTGLGAALFGQALYVPLSGNTDVSAFASSFTSDLLWQRLWPNPSYELGIVPGLLIVAGPLMLVIAFMVWGRFKYLHAIRWLGLSSMSLVLLAGGLVVSVKIGGGGDLHNMDAFAVLLGLVGLYFLTDNVSGEPASGLAWNPAPWPVVAVGLILPVAFLIPSLNPVLQFNEGHNRQLLEQLKTLVAQAEGPVLFINERHLLAQGHIDVDLIHEYEVVTLMEMAMSNNEPYLQQFYDDLQTHRFAMIVAGRQNLVLKDPTVDSFAEENNVWNTRVSPFILCDYELLVSFEPDLGAIDIFVPKSERSCPKLPEMP